MHIANIAEAARVLAWYVVMNEAVGDSSSAREQWAHVWKARCFFFFFLRGEHVVFYPTQRSLDRFLHAR